MKKIIFFIILFASSITFTYGQAIGIGSSVFTPDASAMLEVRATNKGLLVPRVSLQSINDGTTISSPAHSLLVYNESGPLPVGYYYNAGTSISPNWVMLLNNRQAWLLTGNAGTNPASHFIGTIDAQPLIFRTNNTERMLITSDGNVGINTSSPNAAYLLTINPNTNAIRSGISINLTNATSTAFGINIQTSNSNVNGILVNHGSTATTSVLYAVGGILSSTRIVSGYLGYRSSAGNSYGLYGITGTTSTYEGNNLNTWAAFLQGRAVISSEAAPSSPPGIDLEIRNTIPGTNNPATLSMRQTTSETTTGRVLARLNFGDNHTTSPQAQIAIIRDAAGGTNDFPTAITFSTTPDNSNIITEQMRITNAGNVGIGTSAPAARLHVYTETSGQFAIQAFRNTLASNTDLSSVAELIRKTSASTMGATMGVGLLFSLEYGSPATKEFMGAIYAQRNGADNQGRLIFSTRSGGTFPIERMTILHNGNVGIGTSSPWARLNVNNGRLVIEYEDDFVHPGTHYYHRNPWLYLWRKEYPVDARQGGHIIFAASMDNAGTPADLCMIEGARENALNNNTASYLAFFTRPADTTWIERFRINSSGHFHFRPQNARNRTIWINDDGIGGGGSEPTIVPSEHHFGFVGTLSKAWWRMHANQFVSTSSLSYKTNISKLDRNFFNDAYNMVQNMELYSYNIIRHLHDSAGNLEASEIIPRTEIGLLAEKAPEIIQDETGKGIMLYAYINILTAALKETQYRLNEMTRNYNEQQQQIEQLQLRVQQLENIIEQLIQQQKH